MKNVDPDSADSWSLVSDSATSIAEAAAAERTSVNASAVTMPEPSTSAQDALPPAQLQSKQKSTKGGILRHLFETGEQADLFIKTPAKTFRVHKCIVFPAWPLMKALYHESKNGIIKLREQRVALMYAVLKHCYELPIGPVDSPIKAQGVGGQQKTYDRAQWLLMMRIGLDDYEFYAPIKDVETAFTACVNALTDPELLARLGNATFSPLTQEEDKSCEVLKSAVALATARHIKNIRKNPDAEDYVLRCSKYRNKVKEQVAALQAIEEAHEAEVMALEGESNRGDSPGDAEPEWEILPQKYPKVSDTAARLYERIVPDAADRVAIGDGMGYIKDLVRRSLSPR